MPAARSYLHRIAEPLRPGDPVLFAMPQASFEEARPPAQPHGAVLPAWSAELARAMESNPKRVSEQSPGPVGPAPAPGPDGSARQYLGGARAASAAERRGPGTAADLDLRRRPVRQRPVPSA